MGLFKELNRRNVFRVAIAYLVFSWLLLQIIDVLADILSLPIWVPKFILLLLAIGFVIALIVSWAYEITPEGIKKEKEVIRDDSITHITAKKLDKVTIFFLLVGFTFVLVDRFYLQPNAETSVNLQQQLASQQAGTQAVAAKKTLDKSIAILPFSNRSKNEDDKFFTDGIHDDLLTIVSRISDLKVISRTSMMQYRDTIKSLPVIAKELGVATILEGGIQRAGNRVRINVQLIDAETDQHIWAEIYDRTLTADNIFTIQSEITDAIAIALKATLSPSEVASIHKPSTHSLQAYDLYLLGRQYFHKRSPASLTKAIELFKQAIELDPEYALAYSGLADSYSLIFQYGDFALNEARKLNLKNATKAVELAPELAETQASLGLSSAINGEQDKAIALYQKAIELNPNYSMSYVWLGNYYAQNSQPKLALPIFLDAYKVDPLHPLIHENLVDMYLTLNQRDKAEHQLKQTLQTNPDFLLIYPQLVRLNYEKGELVEAYKVANRMVNMDANSPVALANMILSEVSIGSSEGASHSLSKLIKIAPNFAGKPFLRSVIQESQSSAQELEQYYLQQLQTSTSNQGSHWLNSKLALQEFRLNKFAGAIERIDAVDNYRLPPAVQLDNFIVKALSFRQLKKAEKFSENLQQAFDSLKRIKDDGFSGPFIFEKEAILLALQGDLNHGFELLASAYQSGLRNYYFSNQAALWDAVFSSHPQYQSYKDNMIQDISLQKKTVDKLRLECSNSTTHCELDSLKIGI